MSYTLLLIFTVESSFTTVVMSHDIQVDNLQLCEIESAKLLSSMKKKEYKILPDIFCIQTKPIILTIQG